MLCRGNRYILVLIFGSGNMLVFVRRTGILADVLLEDMKNGTLIRRALQVPQPCEGFPVLTMMIEL